MKDCFLHACLAPVATVSGCNTFCCTDVGQKSCYIEGQHTFDSLLHYSR